MTHISNPEEVYAASALLIELSHVKQLIKHYRETDEISVTMKWRGSYEYPCSQVTMRPEKFPDKDSRELMALDIASTVQAAVVLAYVERENNIIKKLAEMGVQTS